MQTLHEKVALSLGILAKTPPEALGAARQRARDIIEDFETRNQRTLQGACDHWISLRDTFGPGGDADTFCQLLAEEALGFGDLWAGIDTPQKGYRFATGFFFFDFMDFSW